MKVSLKKLTIVAERLLREPLVKLINAEGSTGHTLTAVEGEGSRGIHASDWEGRNVQIETIISEKILIIVFSESGYIYPITIG